MGHLVSTIDRVSANGRDIIAGQEGGRGGRERDLLTWRVHDRQAEPDAALLYVHCFLLDGGGLNHAFCKRTMNIYQCEYLSMFIRDRFTSGLSRTQIE